MLYYIYAIFFVLIILQIVSLCSNYWYSNKNYKWGLYNSCQDNICSPITTYGSNKAILYTCRVFMILSIFITMGVLMAIYFNTDKKMIGIALGCSSVLMTLVLLLSIKFRTVNYFSSKQNGSIGSAFIVCFVSIILNSFLMYIYLKKKI